MRIAFIISLFFFSQDQKGGHSKVDQKKVDEAIAKGAKYLLKEIDKGLKDVNHPHGGDIGVEELVLYTLIHAGTPLDDPVFVKLLDKILAKDLAKTYSVSLMAMALEALDREKYQYRIAQCAQFLVDNQCENGQWDYGQPVPLEKKPPPKKDVATDSGSSGGDKKSPGSTKALKKIPVRKRAKGRGVGDNSNAQYAALGLRACLNASIDLPAETLLLALKWWEKAQNSDGGWGYNHQGSQGDPSHGSMSAGAVGACIIYRYHLKVDFKNDKAVRGGLKWLAENWTPKENPRYQMPGMWVYYWLYAVERVGLLYGTEELGKREWYPEGCDFLFAEQKSDGSWDHKPSSLGGAVADTCFAILFLRRATKPLRPVATGDPKKK